MSARHAQIARNADRYEREWMGRASRRIPWPASARSRSCRCRRPDWWTPAGAAAAQSLGRLLALLISTRAGGPHAGAGEIFGDRGHLPVGVLADLGQHGKRL